jgi:hypothetical protein
MHIHGTYKLPAFLSSDPFSVLSTCRKQSRNTEELAARASDISGKKLVHGSGICSRMF